MLSRLWRKLRIALASLGALVVLVHITPLVHWWAQALSVQWNEPRGKVLIVLAGSTLGDGTMGDSTYWRMVYASLAWKKSHFEEILLCGGPEDIPVASSMRSFLVAEGVPKESIRIESTSTSTRENAINAAVMLAQSPAGERMLLTSDYHMLRSVRVFQKAGVQVTPYPIPDAQKRAARWEGRWSAFLDEVRETVKLTYYWVRGWL